MFDIRISRIPFLNSVIFYRFIVLNYQYRSICQIEHIRGRCFANFIFNLVAMLTLIFAKEAIS